MASEVQDEQMKDAWIRARREAIDNYVKTHQIRKLQIGSGVYSLAGWLNTDLEPTHDEVIFLNAIETFPFQDRVFNYVFSEHMIEHISYKQGLFMLKEIFRILEPGGKLRVATPDVERIVSLISSDKTDRQKRYIEWSVRQKLGLYSPGWSRVQIRRQDWAIDHQHFLDYFPNAQEDGASFVVNDFFYGYGHRFLYDFSTLRAALLYAGFVDIERCLPGESRDENLKGIESHGLRIGDEMNLYETMVVESTRP